MIEPLLPSPLHVPLVASLEEQSITLYDARSARSYDQSINVLSYTGPTGRFFLKNEDGSLKVFTVVKSQTKCVCLKASGSLVEVTGITRNKLIKCAVMIADNWVYFNVRFR